LVEFSQALQECLPPRITPHATNTNYELIVDVYVDSHKKRAVVTEIMLLPPKHKKN
jgi:hypothetical protein